MIELMLVVEILSVLAATAIQSFRSYALRAKTAEAIEGTQKMANGEAEYFTKNNTFVAAGPINVPPNVYSIEANFLQDPNWTLINFQFSTNIYYGYQATVPSTNEVDCQAIGDLNGDGVTSLFQRDVTVDASGSMNVGGLLIYDELE